MHYRKVRKDRIKLLGKVYVFPRYYLIAKNGFTPYSVKDFYDALESRRRVGVVTTADHNIIRVYDEQLYKEVGKQSPLHYWYEESHYLTNVVYLI